MKAFNFHNPAAVDEAVARASGSDDKRFVAGGMTLIPTLKQGLVHPSDLINLAGVEELKGIRQDGNNIVIGAMTTHDEVASSNLIKGICIKMG